MCARQLNKRVEKRARQRTNMNGGQAELHGECGAMSKDSGTLKSARTMQSDKPLQVCAEQARQAQIGVIR